MGIFTAWGCVTRRHLRVIEFSLGSSLHITGHWSTFRFRRPLANSPPFGSSKQGGTIRSLPDLLLRIELRPRPILIFDSAAEAQASSGCIPGYKDYALIETCLRAERSVDACFASSDRNERAGRYETCATRSVTTDGPASGSRHLFHATNSFLPRQISRRNPFFLHVHRTGPASAGRILSPNTKSHGCVALPCASLGPFASVAHGHQHPLLRPGACGASICARRPLPATVRVSRCVI
jgi:hypothetical protein